jgi:signal transduction histidine kinase
VELAQWARWLRRDPLTRTGAAILATIALLYLVPGIPRERLREWSGGYFLLALSLWTAVSCFARRRSTGHAEGRRYWSLLGGAFAAWSVAILVSLTPWWTRFTAPLTLLYDALFVASSLFFILATTEAPHRSESWRRILGTQRLVYLGAVIFGVGMTVYFDVLPYVLDRAAFEGRVPGFLLFLTLDAAILLRAATLVKDAPDLRWRLQYGALLAAAAFNAAGDLLDTLRRTGYFAYESPAWDIVWYAIFPPLAIAARLPEGRPSAATGATTSTAQPGTPLLTFAVIVPLIHITLTAIDPESMTADRPHRIVALIVMCALVILARIHEARLDRRGRELAREVESARAQLHSAQKLEAVGRLAGGVAHDFNNKLAVILGYTDILAADAKRVPEIAEPVAAIRDAAEHSARLTGKLLAVGQRQFLLSNLLDLDQTIAELVPTLRTVLGDGIALEIVRSGDPALALADRSGFERSLMNLAANAQEALNGHGNVRIETRVVDIDATELPPLTPRGSGLYVRVEVGDDGPGATPELQQHLFEPFFTTKPFGAGHGLGLAAVRGIVEQCGGFVTVDSAPAAGFRCRLHFPHARETPSGSRRIDPRTLA